MKQEESKLVPAPKMPFDLEIENVELIVPEGANVASGWTPWVATDRGFQEPEFIAVELEDRPRVQGIRSNSRYDACLWQHAKKVTPGLALVFAMNFKIEPSQGRSGESWPEGLVVGVGIDPSGGTDPRSERVQWALRDLGYSKVVTASVTAIAESEMVTAFVRNIAFIPGSTTAAGNGVASVCKVTCVRIEYPRTYLLLYPNASEGLWKKAGEIAQGHNWTMGGSADDAGLGGDLLPKRTVLAVCQNGNGAGWSSDFGEAWYHGHYPPAANLEFKWVPESTLDSL